MKPTPTLLLLPNLLDENAHHEMFLPASVDRAVQTLDGLIVESERAGRSFLRRFKKQLPLYLFNEHTQEDQLDELLSKGERLGLISDCGLPCLADPGARLVFRARQLGISIQAFVGPSSIVLALMLSGLPAQSFAFHGYLNQDPKKFSSQLQMLERRSCAENATQIGIETPYRSQKLLQQLIALLSPETLLCIAWDLTLPTQGVMCHPIRTWRKVTPPHLDKKPAVFLFHAGKMPIPRGLDQSR